MILRFVGLLSMLGALVACGGGSSGTINDCSSAEQAQVRKIYTGVLSTMEPIIGGVSETSSRSELQGAAAELLALADELEERGEWPECGDEVRGLLSDAAHKFADTAQSFADSDIDAAERSGEDGLESLTKAGDAIFADD